nr:HAMP domain-containing sensor histidine kinase [Oceanospirillum sediminis]
MASVGSLVTGVAHELNTPLGVSLTAASFLQAESFRIEESLNAGTLSAEQLRAFLRQSQDTGLLVATNIERTSALIQRFKELGATYSGEAPAEIKINELLQDVIRLAAGYLSNSGIQLHTQGSDQSHLITYPVIISKILLSLIENSVCHAFISPSVQNNPGIWLQAHYESPDLILHYRDNGCGLSEAGKKHIFDPFFSERRTGLNKEICHRQNTGLSMGIVYNLVTQALSGQIRLDHQEEKGFAVIIRFPVSCN